MCSFFIRQDVEDATNNPQNEKPGKKTTENETPTTSETSEPKTGPPASPEPPLVPEMVGSKLRCPECENLYNTVGALNHHRKMMHGYKGRPFTAAPKPSEE